jgi:diguanylate cyclase (GGDEF)-like protein
VTIRLHPAQRTVVLYVMGLLFGLAMLLTVLTYSHKSGQSAGLLTSKALPAETALREVMIAARSTQVALLGASQTHNPEDLADGLTTIGSEERHQTASWVQYLRYALNEPGEQSLQREYEQSSISSLHATARLVSLAPLDPRFANTLLQKLRNISLQLAALDALDAKIYLPSIRSEAHSVKAGVDATRTAAAMSYGVLALLLTITTLGLLRGALRDQRLLATEADALRAAGEQAEFEGALERGLDMESSEESAISLLAQAAGIVSNNGQVELLLADSSEAHFRRAFSTDADLERGCRVSSPRNCPAASSGQTRLFEDSNRLDACHFMRERNDRVTAVCVPINIAGRATGVFHAQHAVGQTPPVDLTTRLELVARKAGDRIGQIRLLARTETQAQIDPLTGLPNRRTLENQAREVLKESAPFVVAFADLDHFKGINDGHGHDVGDRALRLFARVLRDRIRPCDLLARYGGEEFVAVLPGCELADARIVAERVRMGLAETLAHASVPHFTVTIGLAAGETADELADVIARADAAMLEAKSLGRDRTLAIGDD